jgi:hypothetical protein
MNSNQIYKIIATLTPAGFMVEIRSHDSNRVSTDQVRFLIDTEDKISVMKYCISGHQGDAKETLIRHISNKLAIRKKNIERMNSELYRRHQHHNTRYVRTNIPKEWKQSIDYPD